MAVWYMKEITDNPVTGHEMEFSDFTVTLSARVTTKEGSDIYARMLTKKPFLLTDGVWEGDDE